MMDFLLSPGMAKIIERQKATFFEQTMVPAAMVWDPDKTKFRQNLCLVGSTFRPEQLYQTEPVPSGTTHLQPDQAALSPCGQHVYCVRTLPRGTPLDLYQGRQRGQVWFTTDVDIPILSRVTEYSSKPDRVMSITPHEIISLRPAVRMAFGRVMIGGLGLGWLLNRVCQQTRVESVVIVEKSNTLVEWLKPRLESFYPAVKQKVKEWVVDDVYRQIGKHDADCHLIDIWDDYGDAHNDQTFQDLKKSHSTLWGWGDTAV